MKKNTFVILVLLVGCGFTLRSQSLTETERTIAVNYLTETKAYLENAIKGLSEAQLKFKPSPERWSIMECLEHITNAETLAYNSVMQTVTQPANPEKRVEIKITDDELLKKVVDRTGKAKAPEVLQPTGKYATAKDVVAAWKAQRDKTLAYVKTTQDNLRGHVYPHPFFGMLDAYQWILLSGGHQKRHTLQMEEVKADKNFPKM